MFCNYDTYFREKLNLIKEIESWKTMDSNAASVGSTECLRDFGKAQN